MSDLIPQPSGNLITPDRLEGAFDRYLQTDVGEGDASSDTLKTYRGNIKQFLAWCDRQLLHPLAATRKQLKEFRLWLLETQQYKRATVALKLSVVRRFYEALIENELTSYNPALGLKPPREAIDPAAKINYLESEEMRSLIENLPEDNSAASLRDRLIVGLMGIQGCRTIEMHRVSVGDIVKRGQDVGLKVSGKRSIRIVPLTPDLAALLRQYLTARKQAGERLAADTPLFVSYSRNCQSGRISRRSLGRIIEKYLVKCGLRANKTNKAHKVANKATIAATSKSLQTRVLRQLSAHSLRHTAGTLALRVGASLRQVQDLLGHADPRTTALYAHIADRWQANPALLVVSSLKA